MLIAVATALLSSPAYSIQRIFTHDSSSDAGGCYAINDKSQVLCYSFPDLREGTGVAFLWDKGKITNIPVPEAGDGETTGIYPRGLNNDGTVVGVRFRSWGQPSIVPGVATSEEIGFRWNAAEGFQPLMVNGENVMPSAINNKNDIVGVIIDPSTTVSLDLPGVQRSGPATTLGILSRARGFVEIGPTIGPEGEVAVGMNDKEEIVGQQAATCHAYRITKAGEYLTLRTPLGQHYNPVPTTYADSRVWAINNAGWVAGEIDKGEGIGTGKDRFEGAVWSPENSYYFLGDGGYRPYDINDKGQVVGSMVAKVNKVKMDMRAFIWDAKSGVRYLDSMLPADSPTLAKAASINNRGEIVCQGLDNRNAWYLLTPNK